MHPLTHTPSKQQELVDIPSSPHFDLNPKMSMNPATPHESAFSFHPLPKRASEGTENENRLQSNGFMSCFKRDTPLAAASHRSFFSRGRLLNLQKNLNFLF